MSEMNQIAAGGADEMSSMDVTATPVARARPRPWTVFDSASFRKLWAVTTLSMFGDFFSYIAMAWLVLQLTGSSLALGTVTWRYGCSEAADVRFLRPLGAGRNDYRPEPRRVGMRFSKRRYTAQVGRCPS